VIGMTGALIAAAALVLLLLAWARADKAMRDLPSDSGGWLSGLEEDAGISACPPEFVSQIFSNDDQAYVLGLNSRELERQFRHERNGVALLWVQQTSAAVQQIMRQHVEASRRSRDIEIMMEARILLQYARLRAACALLFVGIGLAGAEEVRSMALYTDGLTHRIGQVLREFDAGLREREMKNAMR